MSYEVNSKREKQTEIMELLHEDLICGTKKLEEATTFTLERDLDNAIIQMQMHFLAGRM
ncbi:MAG TPA: hypothetical protein VLG38_04295 [Gammaproteobacteria bacterium]|nr:hypothetical protein [Gammaproteobacteria bacterium]